MIEQYDVDREDRLTEGSPAVATSNADHAARVEAFIAARATPRPCPCPYCPAAVKGGAPWTMRRVHDGVDHAARLEKESPWQPGVTLHQWTFGAACGATWEEWVDSGD